MAIPVNFLLGQFEEGFCFESPQQFADALVALLTGTIGGSFSGIIISANPPAVTDQDKAWLKVDATGRPVGLFIYKGTWLSRHPIAASSSFRRIWVGSEADLWAEDGGDGTDPSSNAPTATTGAMWQRDTAFDFRFPVGIGTSGTAFDGNPASAIAVGDTGGAERVKLAEAEVGIDFDHRHITGRHTVSGSGAQHVLAPLIEPALTSAENLQIKDHGGADSGTIRDLQDVTGEFGVTTSPNLPPTQVSHQNMPPFRGVIYAKRTARVFVTAS